VYNLLGSLVSAKSGSCLTTGTPTVLSNAFGHVGPNNGFLLYDEKLYVDNILVRGGPCLGGNCPSELQLLQYLQTATDQQKTKYCQYDKNGNFWYPLSDTQKRVLTDMQANYSVFICPFTGKPTPPSSSSTGHTTVTYSGTVNVRNLTNTQSNVTKSISNKMSIQETPSFTCDGCTHDEILAKWISRFPDGSMVPVLVLFKNQLTPEELKAHMTINSTGRFDLEGEVKLIQSYGGIVKPTIISITNFYGADVPKDKVFAIQDDPRVWSVDGDWPMQTADIAPPNGVQFRYLNGTLRDVPNPFVNSTDLANSTMNSNASANLSVNDGLVIHSKESFSSPLKQEKSGISVKDIQCKQGFVLLVKAANGHPVCVKPTTATRLVSHGWITLEVFESTHTLPNHIVGGGVQINPKHDETVNTTTPSTLPHQNTTSLSNGTDATGSIQLPLGISTPTISSNKPGIKILSIQMSPDPLKVGDMPIFTIIYQNISNKIMGHQTGCTASSLGYTLSPPDYVQELPPGAVACADQLQSIQPNATATDYGRSYHLDGFYKIVREGTLNVTMHLYLQKDDPLGLDLVETVQFNVNATDTSLSNNITSTNQKYYPVYVSPAVGTINESALPPITEIPPRSAVSTTPLPPITQPTTINYSDPNIVKITAVGMSPNPLKVGDNHRFTVTYKNTSGKPLYGISACGWDLSYAISSSNVEGTWRYDLLTCAQYGDIIEANQTITEEARSYYNYKIIQPGLLQVTLTLSLRPQEDYSQVINDTIQFDVNATQ